MKFFNTTLIKLHQFITRLRNKDDLIHITKVLSEPGKILLVPESGIEDALLTVPIARAIKKIYPKTELTVVLLSELMDFLKGVKAINHIVEYEERSNNPFEASFKEVIRRITSQSYDIAVDISRNLNYETALLVGYSGAKVKMGFHKPETSNFYNFVIQSSVEEVSYEFLINHLLGPLGVKVDFENLSFHLSRRMRDEGKKFLEFKGFQFDPCTETETSVKPIGFFPDLLSVNNGLKDSHLFYFLKEMKKVNGIRVVIAQNMIPPKVIEKIMQNGSSLIPRESIAYTLSILSACDCVVTNNPGIVLFMSMGKIPVIYFGSEEKVRDIPIGRDKVSLVRSNKKEALVSSAIEITTGGARDKVKSKAVEISAV